MSQREMLFVLAHAQFCTTCRQRLLADPQAVFAGRALTTAEKEALIRLTDTDFFTSERLAKASGATVAELNANSDHPVVRLRHF